MRTVHVIQRGTKPPLDAGPDDQIWKYGQGLHGIADRLIVHDAPKNDDDLDWLRDYAFTRLAPEATILTNKQRVVTFDELEDGRLEIYAGLFMEPDLKDLTETAHEVRDVMFKEPMPTFEEMEGAGTETWKLPNGRTVEMNAAVSHKLADDFLAKGWVLLDV